MIQGLKITAVLCFCQFFLQTGVCRAEGKPPPAPVVDSSIEAENAASPVKPPEIDSSILTESANSPLKSLITLSADRASLPDILKILADRSEMNFVASEDASRQKISIILNNTPLDEAIDLLVRAAGLSYEIIGNSVLIAAPERLTHDHGEVGQKGYVVALKYANAREVAVMLEKITPDIRVDDAGNRLVCFAGPRTIKEIERMVKSIDSPNIMVMLETRLVETAVTKDNKYGIDWAQLTPIMSGLAHGDAALPGNWTLLHPTSGSAGSPTSGSNGSSSSSGTTASGLNLTLDLMIANGDARLLMDSKLTTTNNRPASLYIGDVYPYEIQSYNMGSSGGSGANLSIQKEETGIKISMEPHVNKNNEVTLSLEPEVSNVVDFVGVNHDLPHTQVRKTTTTIRVEDGRTVFIAGLLQQQKNVVENKVPLLGDIPFLGLLFRHRQEDLSTTNLILEITPRIQRDSAKAE